jgi:hypothetical protein
LVLGLLSPRQPMEPRLLLALAVVPAALFAQQPDAQEIVRRSVAAQTADWNAAPNYSFVERDTVAKHGAATSKTYEVLMIGGSQYNRLIAVGGRPLSSGEQADEDRRVQQEIQRRKRESPSARGRRVEKYERERQQDHAMMLEMGEGFSFKLAGSEKVDGHDTWLLEATPKPGYQPKTRDTKVLTGMKGKLWVDKEQYHWVKVEAEVFRPVSFYGFLAKVGQGTRFVLENEPVDGGVWLPKHFAVTVNSTALGFIKQDSNNDETYRDYQPNAKALAMVARATAGQ